MDSLRQLSVLADGVRVAEGCRMRIRGRSTMTLRPDIWELTVFGMGDQSLATVRSASELEIEGEDLSLLCSGQVEEIYTHYENGREQTTIVISDGMNFWMSTVNLTLAGRNSVKETIRTLINRCTNPVPIAALQSEDAIFLRGQAFHGRTAGYIATLAKSVKARAFFTRGFLSIMEKGVENNSIVLADDDISSVSYADGACIVKMADMRGYPIGQLVQIPEDAGRYRLLCQSVDADNYQGVWQTELILVEESRIATGDDWGGG